ncbi:MAG: hypothetical protein KAI70_02895 [Candidatus Omnitrophica bacterium]|nr:hypothetical protein [Candidatus Omnitrophota bacterium]
MLGERLILNNTHKKIAKNLFKILIVESQKHKERYSISIAGESGSGKSGVAHAITNLMNEYGIKTRLIQQDDYFFIPPKTNFRIRREDISIIKMSEVNLELLQEHINKFKKSKSKKIKKPLVVFDEDEIREETISLESVKILVVEGTYVSVLENIDKKIFLAKDYKDTFNARRSRNREELDLFDEKILRAEHKIVKNHANLNDIIVKKDSKIILTKSSH